MTAQEGGFRPLTTVTARWGQEDGFGTEHLTLEQHGERITATGIVTSAEGENPYAAWYQIFLDCEWRTKAVSVHRTDSRWYIAQSPEPGRWCDGDGTAIEKLAGCRDIVLLASQFSVTPMIRRLSQACGATCEHDVFALSLETLVLVRQGKMITCLEPVSRYLFEDLKVGEGQEIGVDTDGLLLQAAGKFNRVS